MNTEDTGAPGPRIAAPEMPRGRWLARTREWWDAWTRSTQTAVFEPSEWSMLAALVPLVDAMHREEDALRKAKLFDHIHKAEKALGGTHADRLRARIESAGAGPAGGPGAAGGGPEQGGESAEGVAVLDEYRDMLNPE